MDVNTVDITSNVLKINFLFVKKKKTIYKYIIQNYNSIDNVKGLIQIWHNQQIFYCTLFYT